MTGHRLGHFVLYIILGFFFPKKFLFFLYVGIVWELIEYTIRRVTKNKWWGSDKDHIADIFTNIAGFCTGAYICLINKCN